MWRGNDIPQYLVFILTTIQKENPFFEYRIFNRLDPEIKAERITFEEYWIN